MEVVPEGSGTEESIAFWSLLTASSEDSEVIEKDPDAEEVGLSHLEANDPGDGRRRHSQRGPSGVPWDTNRASPRLQVVFQTPLLTSSHEQTR